MPYPSPNELDRVMARLTETLVRDGWKVRVSKRGIRARWRWLSVTLKRQDDRAEPWRARLRDGFPRVTVTEHWASDPLHALNVVIPKARAVRQFSDGRRALVQNPSKTWLGHRLWEATRPLETE